MIVWISVNGYQRFHPLRKYESITNGLYANKVVILAGFYDMPSFQNPFLHALLMTGKK